MTNVLCALVVTRGTKGSAEGLREVYKGRDKQWYKAAVERPERKYEWSLKACVLLETGTLAAWMSISVNSSK